MNWWAAVSAIILLSAAIVAGDIGIDHLVARRAGSCLPGQSLVYTVAGPPVCVQSYRPQ